MISKIQTSSDVFSVVFWNSLNNIQYSYSKISQCWYLHSIVLNKSSYHLSLCGLKLSGVPFTNWQVVSVDINYPVIGVNNLQFTFTFWKVQVVVIIDLYLYLYWLSKIKMPVFFIFWDCIVYKSEGCTIWMSIIIG